MGWILIDDQHFGVKGLGLGKQASQRFDQNRAPCVAANRHTHKGKRVLFVLVVRLHSV